MSIQIACHKCIHDKLTNKLLTSARFAHFEVEWTVFIIKQPQRQVRGY
jgi:hypothetical protein